ncbi:MAG: helix-turn-helix domain-containing protein [Gammaproteobacteria bacterium]
MQHSFDTSTYPVAERPSRWRECLVRTFSFEVELEFSDPDRFAGRLATFNLGQVSLSLLGSAPLRYRRLVTHLADEGDEYYLISLPTGAPFHFSQRRRTAVCAPGSFTIERSGEPYELSYGEPNLLHVLKIPSRLMRRTISAPDRLCAVHFDAAHGAGALFSDYLTLLTRHLTALATGGATVAGNHVMELLAFAVEHAGKGCDSGENAVQSAHLLRIEDHVRRHLGDPALSPATLAAAAGISVRYLHRLFARSGRTVSGHIRELRLEACHEALVRDPTGITLGALAYRWGFSDQANFCRLFKARYGLTPGEARRAARAGRMK